MTSISVNAPVKFASVTPNLIVRDIAVSTAFYRDVLGFEIKQTVPDAAPFVFVWLEKDGVPVFLNDPAAVAHDVPAAAALPPGGTATMFFVISGVDAYHSAIAARVNVVMPLKTQFYGMREFAITDPDGHIITFAERVAAD
jgi:catechol 2,3-dioxygenase-like lactoylglutathione lyase family enzyme